VVPPQVEKQKRTSMIKVAVVILNWNGKSFLDSYLPSVTKYSTGQEVQVVVADNFSTDGSVAFLRSTFPDVRVIELDKNYGFAGGYNKALEQIDAKYFVLLNSDAEVTENWIAPVIERFEQDDKIAAAMPKLLSWHNKDYFEYAGAAGGFIDKYGYTFCRGRIFDELERDNRQYEKESEIFWSTGACTFIVADLFRKAGGFDADFFAHMEEIDLCWRLKNMGYKIIYTPLSTVYHFGGGSLPKSNPWKTYLNFRNNLWLLYKNLPDKWLHRKMTARLFLDGLSVLKFFSAGMVGEGVAVVKAHFTFWTSIVQIRRKRKAIAHLRVKSNHKEIYQKSIVIDFFIRKKRLFSQLNYLQDK
jgi:GT2 family glycosyltransferase